MIRSMTGYGHASGTLDASRWSWDIRTVNAKGLDLRLRLPQGFDTLEIEARRRIGSRLARGTCHATLNIARDAGMTNVRFNTDLLTVLVRGLAEISVPAAVGPATLDGLLAIRGVIEIDEKVLGEAETAALRAAFDRGLNVALETLVAMRSDEGAALEDVLRQRLTTIERLTRQADGAPERQPEAIRDRLRRTIATLAERHALDPDRLHQEALILAAKADVREELDRLLTHCAAATDLIQTGGPVGWRLDFLAQELAREASTYCAKVNDAALTAIGLELRVEIEQFREQVQNIE